LSLLQEIDFIAFVNHVNGRSSDMCMRMSNKWFSVAIEDDVVSILQNGGMALGFDVASDGAELAIIVDNDPENRDPDIYVINSEPLPGIHSLIVPVGHLRLIESGSKEHLRWLFLTDRTPLKKDDSNA
jgi:hypothetical protein